MADRPIPFSGPMVRALLDGHKTQTRRVLRRQPAGFVTDVFPTSTEIATNLRVFNMRDRSGKVVYGLPCRDGFEAELIAPAGIGDRLYVREAWRTELRHDDFRPRDLRVGARVYYEAGGGGEEALPACAGRFRHGMHMPRWASRLTLVVTDVRVERLKDITEADAYAEGRERLPPEASMSPVDRYRLLWDELNMARGYGWDANPWVVAYTFTTHASNIDALERIAA